MATGLRQLTPREQAIVQKYSLQHGRVVGLEMPIADVTGAIGNPLVRLGTLQRLEQRGTISRAEAEAGERFHTLFQLAALDTLHAADMGRVPVAPGTVSGDLPPSHERCRARIAEAIAALGGNASLAASVIWHCCGLEWSPRRWSIATRRPKEVACGALVASLAVLASHFAGERRVR